MLIRLAQRDIYRLSGADRVRFLNGQVTNDILHLPEAQGVHACALSAKGKLSGDLFVTAWAEEIFLDWESVLSETLVPRLERYIIADDVALEAQDCSLFHFLGPLDNVLLPDGVRVASSSRFRQIGVDLFVPNSSQLDLPQALNRPILNDAELEEFRIERGIPKWGAELNANVIPVEAGLDQDAISYTKGCYLGQEVISRIRSVGHVNRHLRGVRLTKGETLQIGAALLGAAQKNVGYITSAVLSQKRGERIGLAFVRRGYELPGARYTLNSPGEPVEPGEVEICDLPFS